MVCGVSGSGKTSLVFDTLYHEAHRRFLDVFATGSNHTRLSPADVRKISGLGPAVAVGQNLLNRNPLSTLASASGIHPFLRLLFARFSLRYCVKCGHGLSLFTQDEIIDMLLALPNLGSLLVFAPLFSQLIGSHATLLTLLSQKIPPSSLFVDGLSLG